MANEAVGATVNPVLITSTVNAHADQWRAIVDSSLSDLTKEKRAEELTKQVTQQAATMLQSQHEQSQGQSGYVCAQVDPALVANRQAMIDMGQAFNAWAPNIAVKLPATAAGLDALEECIVKGITVVCTVSFTVPQVLAIGARYEKALARAKQENVKPGKCFAVIMIGRIDDYLQEVANDSGLAVDPSDIKCAGLAIAKRAYSIFKERNYSATLMVAALRGTYHMIELAGADVVMSIHPKYQKMLLEPDTEKVERIATPVDPQIIKRLQAIPEFVRAYEPDGMCPEEFITFGVVQKTLSQFQHAGWLALQSFCQ